MSAARIQVINGPNLGRLGTRQPEVYGATTHADLTRRCTELGAALGVDVLVRQSDHEGQLLEWIHQAADDGDPVVLNAGGLTHTSVVLRDACAELDRLVEVHISNVHAREEFRHHSFLSPVATGVIVGLGVAGYDAAIRFLAS
ncbi:type II 3-dehydroquinate dehydratase [Tomitella gaofuii]|uniref:type II 3-dehydroquinate dehydratase n=1 Tax=Tomitella gaofuii TaxID=2760083 RepID=UPI0015FD8B82|nr:type II 3-dehydroquinate dehydratase [Tomitella gaofuii]